MNDAVNAYGEYACRCSTCAAEFWSGAVGAATCPRCEGDAERRKAADGLAEAARATLAGFFGDPAADVPGDPIARLRAALRHWDGLHGRSEATQAAAAAATRLPPDAAYRCAWCGWNLVSLVSAGCTRGNCSMRPLPTRLFDPERAAREAVERGRAPT